MAGVTARSPCRRTSLLGSSSSTLAFAFVLFLALLCASAPKTARAQQEAGEVVPIYDTSTFDYHHHVATRHNGAAWTERDASVDSPVSVAVAFDPSWVRTAGPDGGAHGVYKALGPDATGNRTREPTLLTSADPQQWALALASVQVLVVAAPGQGSDYSESGEAYFNNATAADGESSLADVIRSWTAAGGLFVQAGRDAATLEFLFPNFGYPQASTASSLPALVTSAADGTPYAASSGNTSASLEALATAWEVVGVPDQYCLYSTGDGDNSTDPDQLPCAVVRQSYGAGRVIYLAWDFADAAPDGTQDGSAWMDVLYTAVLSDAPLLSLPASSPSPSPSPSLFLSPSLSPSPSSSPSPSLFSSLSPSPSPSSSPSPSLFSSLSPSPSPSPSNSPLLNGTVDNVTSPSPSPSQSAYPSPSPSPSATPSLSSSYSASPTFHPSPTVSLTPSPSHLSPSASPSAGSSYSPSPSPTDHDDDDDDDDDDGPPPFVMDMTWILAVIVLAIVVLVLVAVGVKLFERFSRRRDYTEIGDHADPHDHYYDDEAEQQHQQQYATHARV